MAQGHPHEIFYPPPDKSEMSVHEQQIFGIHAKRHPVTGMPLETGSGAHPPDMQARLVHVPEIRRTQGDAAANAMLIKLAGAERRLAIVK